MQVLGALAIQVLGVALLQAQFLVSALPGLPEQQEFDTQVLGVLDLQESVTYPPTHLPPGSPEQQEFDTQVLGALARQVLLVVYAKQLPPLLPVQQEFALQVFTYLQQEFHVLSPVKGSV